MQRSSLDRGNLSERFGKAPRGHHPGASPLQLRRNPHHHVPPLRLRRQNERLRQRRKSNEPARGGPLILVEAAIRHDRHRCRSGHCLWPGSNDWRLTTCQIVDLRPSLRAAPSAFGLIPGATINIRIYSEFNRNNSDNTPGA